MKTFVFVLFTSKYLTMTQSTSPSTPSPVETDISSSRNWKAIAIPSLDGRTTELNVTGEVRSGIVAPQLTKRITKQKRPPNVAALDLTGVAGGQFVQVSYSEDITGKKLDIVLVYTPNNEIEAAILIEKVMA